jgi:NAD(P)-dependent dehydrogenase (short-subunit alcohol dehydrogenase family)
MDEVNRRRLTGAAVIVTGAAHGIGVAYARRLAAESARLVVADLDGDAAEKVAASLREEGREAIAVQVLGLE